MENNVKFKSYWLKQDVDDETYINRVVYKNDNGKDKDYGNGDGFEGIKSGKYNTFIGFALVVGLFLAILPLAIMLG